jgi:Fe-S-cluster containining protein
LNLRMPNQRKLSIDCRPGCGACCIAPSISSPIPGMPEGKPAGIRCIQLTEDNYCKIFGSSLRPMVCSSLMPSQEMCGADNQAAMDYLNELERETACIAAPNKSMN